MRMYCISDNIETAVGLKTTGIQTSVAQTKEESDMQIEQVLKEKNIGILIVTDKIYDLSKVKLDEIKQKLKTPLVVKI